jgi:hypothetical protein
MLRIERAKITHPSTSSGQFSDFGTEYSLRELRLELIVRVKSLPLFLGKYWGLTLREPEKMRRNP